jgi:hypothetical protein
MAKVQSLFHVSGDVGDAAFQIRNGNCILKQPSRISKSRMMTDRAFKRTRENMKEFTAAMLSASAFRVALGGLMKDYADRRMSNRLSKTLNQVIRKATGTRGERPMEISQNPASLRGFELHKTDKFINACTFTGYDVVVNPARTSATLTIPVFDIDAFVGRPQGATHFKFSLALGALSDRIYDSGVSSYVPASPAEDGVGVVERSAAFDYDTPFAAPTVLTANLPVGTVMTPSAALIVGIGIEFYQEVGGQLYILASGNAMKVHDLY